MQHESKHVISQPKWLHIHGFLSGVQGAIAVRTRRSDVWMGDNGIGIGGVHGAGSNSCSIETETETRRSNRARKRILDARQRAHSNFLMESSDLLPVNFLMESSDLLPVDFFLVLMWDRAWKPS